LGVPGDAKHLVVTDSDEHDEDGHITEDAEIRIHMLEKRLFKKLPHMQEEIAPPFLYGEHGPDIVITGWGSLYGLLREAVDELSRSYGIAMLHFSEIYPFPGTGKFDYLELLKGAKLTICVEQNAAGQFARLMRTETGFEFKALLNKYDGRSFTVESLVKNLKGMIKKL
jgi:2-oxoglutarate ferredoxin oxidoreductase subunit alpha